MTRPRAIKGTLVSAAKEDREPLLAVAGLLADWFTWKGEMKTSRGRIQVYEHRTTHARLYLDHSGTAWSHELEGEISRFRPTGLSNAITAAFQSTDGTGKTYGSRPVPSYLGSNGTPLRPNIAELRLVDAVADVAWLREHPESGRGRLGGTMPGPYYPWEDEEYDAPYGDSDGRHAAYGRSDPEGRNSWDGRPPTALKIANDDADVRGGESF